jgi:hypothetical protein
MSVRDGRLVLPDGMSYRVLVLPDVDRMTPAVAEKVKQLIADGATVYGPRPIASPSLSDFPNCDETVKRIGEEVWGDCDGKSVTEHAFGKGRVVWGKPIQQAMGAAPDFQTAGKLIRFIHRRDGDADIYFVANGKPVADTVECTFRIAGRVPELWNPDSGEIAPAVAYSVKDGRTTVPLRFDGNGSIFVVFRQPAPGNVDPIASITRGGEQLLAGSSRPRSVSTLVIRKAVYGILSDPAKQTDVTEKLAAEVKDGYLSTPANNSLASTDPAKNVHKQLRVDYTVDGKPMSLTVEEGDELQLPELSASRPPVVEPIATRSGKPALCAWDAGKYSVKHGSGRQSSIDVALPPPIDVTGAWRVRFPPKLLAPDHITLDKLESWTANADAGVKYFSGTATYTKSFDVPAGAIAKDARLYLDLGDVKNLAEVTLNGKPIGILWKPPFRIDVTDSIRPGANQLEVKVTNLWPNRMIGDLSLPENQRVTWSAYQPFKTDSPLLESGLLGPVKIVPAKVVEIVK